MADTNKQPTNRIGLNVSEQISADGTPKLPESTVTAPTAPQPQPETQQTNENKDTTPTSSPDSTSSLVSNPDNAREPDTEKVKPDGEQPTGDSDKIVDFSDFLNAKEGITKPAEKTVEAEPGATAQPKSGLPAQRDYSDIPEEDRPLFKEMNNAAFAKLKPIYLEQKAKEAALAAKDTEIAELKKGALPENYYEHPDAVVLSPEFNQTSNAVNLANTIAKHWEDQFDKVKAGEPEYQTIHLNDKGELYLSEPIKADRNTETKLMKYVTWSQGQLTSKQTELNSLIKTHRDRHNEVVNVIRDYENRAFPMFSDPKNKELQAIVADTMKTFPKALHNNPIMGMLVKSMVLSTLLGKELQKRPATQTASGKQVTQQRANGNGNLSAAEIAGEGGGRVNTTKLGESFDDFLKYKDGLPV